MKNLTNTTKDIKLSELDKTISSVVDKSMKILDISTNLGDEYGKIYELATIDDKILSEIKEGMPEMNRALQAFGRQNSQATGQLMTLNMLNLGPYHRLKQVLAQIENKKQALKDNTFNLQKVTVEIKKIRSKISRLERKLNDSNEILSEDDIEDIEYEIELLNIELAEKLTGISDGKLYIEGALKEIALYQQAYEEMRLANNIPENWDEIDYERAEIEAHIKTAMQHALRDVISHGSLGMGTLEYLEQYGINPVSALLVVRQYLAETDKMIQNNEIPSIEMQYEFYEKCYNLFGDEYKKALKFIGINDYVREEIAFKDNNKKE